MSLPLHSFRGVVFLFIAFLTQILSAAGAFADDSLSLAGKVCVVTGGNSGIGKETARAFSKLGAHVVIVSRSESKGREVAEEIRGSGAPGPVDVLTADFTRLESVSVLAKELHARYERIDVLVNNAGVSMKDRVLTPDGYETTLSVNYLAPFLLTHLVRDMLERGAPAQVVNVSSDAHKAGRLDLNDLQLEKNYGGLLSYGRSKLALMLFSNEFARQMAEKGVTSNSIHPGIVDTPMGDREETIGPFKFVVKAARVYKTLFGRNPMTTAEQSAGYIARLVTDPELKGVTGQYFLKDKLVPQTKKTSGIDDAKRLWNKTLEILGLPGSCEAKLLGE